MFQKKIHILGGGTVSYVRPHLALAAPAYGETARAMDGLFRAHSECEGPIVLHLTKMACCGASSIETNDDVEQLFDKLVGEPETGIIVMNVAMVDYDGVIEDGGKGGKYGDRLKTREQPNPTIETTRVRKFLSSIRDKRPDIFLVAFKTVCHASTDDMRTRGSYLLNGAGCGLVLVNDTGTRLNMIVGPDGQCLMQTTDRYASLVALVDLTVKGAQQSAATAFSPPPVSAEQAPAPPTVEQGGAT